MARIFACGFDHQLNVPAVNGGGNHPFVNKSAPNGSPSTGVIDPDGGTTSWDILLTNAFYNDFSPVALGTVTTGRYRFRLDTIPAATMVLLKNTNANGNLIIQITSAGQLQVKAGAGAAANFGSAIAANTWYRIDFCADASTGTASMKAQLDGSGEGTSTNAQASASFTTCSIGSDVVQTGVHHYYDNAVLDNAAAVYPIGKGYVIATVRSGNTSGTHNQTAGDLQNDAGTNITDGDGSGAKINEALPADTTTYIKQIVVRTTTYYENIFDASAVTAAPKSVMAVAIATTSSTPNPSNFKAQLYDGTTATDLLALSTQKGLGTRGVAGFFATAPSGGAWTVALLQSCRGRYGFSTTTDATTYSRLTNFVLELEYLSPDSPPRGDNVIPSQAVQRAASW